MNAPPQEPQWSTVAGSAYRDLIDGQLKREDARKTSFEARGMQIISSSGTMVTLLFGLAALVTGTKDFKLGDSSKVALAVALALLLVAAVCGIATNVPLEYAEADPTTLTRLLDDRFWLGRLYVGQRRAAELEIAQLVVGRSANGLKAKLLIMGLGLEVLGVLAVGVAVLLVLT